MSSRVEEVADAAGGGVWVEEDMVLTGGVTAREGNEE